MTTPKLYMLIGVPGSGKSTWIKSQDWIQDCVVVSTDNFIEAEATAQGKTYNEVFESVIKDATSRMKQDVKTAVEAGKDIIWDQTNTTAKSRKSKLDMVKGYKKIAIVFNVPEEAELNRRLEGRPGKSIPWHVMDSMIEGFAMPNEDEGFDEIWHT